MWRAPPPLVVTPPPSSGPHRARDHAAEREREREREEAPAHSPPSRQGSSPQPIPALQKRGSGGRSLASALRRTSGGGFVLPGPAPGGSLSGPQPDEAPGPSPGTSGHSSAGGGSTPRTTLAQYQRAAAVSAAAGAAAAAHHPGGHGGHGALTLSPTDPHVTHFRPATALGAALDAPGLRLGAGVPLAPPAAAAPVGQPSRMGPPRTGRSSDPGGAQRAASAQAAVARGGGGGGGPGAHPAVARLQASATGGGGGGGVGIGSGGGSGSQAPSRVGSSRSSGGASASSFSRAALGPDSPSGTARQLSHGLQYSRSASAAGNGAGLASSSGRGASLLGAAAAAASPRGLSLMAPGAYRAASGSGVPGSPSASPSPLGYGGAGGGGLAAALRQPSSERPSGGSLGSRVLPASPAAPYATVGGGGGEAAGGGGGGRRGGGGWRSWFGGCLCFRPASSYGGQEGYHGQDDFSVVAQQRKEADSLQQQQQRRSLSKRLSRALPDALMLRSGGSRGGSASASSPKGPGSLSGFQRGGRRLQPVLSMQPSKSILRKHDDLRRAASARELLRVGFAAAPDPDPHAAEASSGAATDQDGTPTPAAAAAGPDAAADARGGAWVGRGPPPPSGAGVVAAAGPGGLALAAAELEAMAARLRAGGVQSGPGGLGGGGGEGGGLSGVAVAPMDARVGSGGGALEEPEGMRWGTPSGGHLQPVALAVAAAAPRPHRPATGYRPRPAAPASGSAGWFSGSPAHLSGSNALPPHAGDSLAPGPALPPPRKSASLRGSVLGGGPDAAPAAAEGRRSLVHRLTGQLSRSVLFTAAAAREHEALWVDVLGSAAERSGGASASATAPQLDLGAPSSSALPSPGAAAAAAYSAAGADPAAPATRRLTTGGMALVEESRAPPRQRRRDSPLLLPSRTMGSEGGPRPASLAAIGGSGSSQAAPPGLHRLASLNPAPYAEGGLEAARRRQWATGEGLAPGARAGEPLARASLPGAPPSGLDVAGPAGRGGGPEPTRMRGSEWGQGDWGAPGWGGGVRASGPPGVGPAESAAAVAAVRSSSGGGSSGSPGGRFRRPVYLPPMPEAEQEQGRGGGGPMVRALLVSELRAEALLRAGARGGGGGAEEGGHGKGEWLSADPGRQQLQPRASPAAADPVGGPPSPCSYVQPLSPVQQEQPSPLLRQLRQHQQQQQEQQQEQQQQQRRYAYGVNDDDDVDPLPPQPDSPASDRDLVVSAAVSRAVTAALTDREGSDDGDDDEGNDRPDRRAGNDYAGSSDGGGGAQEEEEWRHINSGEARRMLATELLRVHSQGVAPGVALATLQAEAATGRLQHQHQQQHQPPAPAPHPQQQLHRHRLASDSAILPTHGGATAAPAPAPHPTSAPASQPPPQAGLPKSVSMDAAPPPRAPPPGPLPPLQPPPQARPAPAFGLPLTAATLQASAETLVKLDGRASAGAAGGRGGGGGGVRVSLPAAGALPAMQHADSLERWVHHHRGQTASDPSQGPMDPLDELEAAAVAAAIQAAGGGVGVGGSASWRAAASAAAAAAKAALAAPAARAGPVGPPPAAMPFARVSAGRGARLLVEPGALQHWLYTNNGGGASKPQSDAVYSEGGGLPVKRQSLPGNVLFNRR